MTTWVCPEGHVTTPAQVSERDRGDVVVRCKYRIGVRMECSREARRQEVKPIEP